MSLEDLILGVGAFGFFGLIAACAISDALRREIPNRLVVALALGSSLFVLSGLLPVTTFGTALLVAAVLMVLGAHLLSRGWIGGGDVKYMAAVILWFPPLHGISFIGNALVLGAILAIIILLLRTLVQNGYVSVGRIQRRFLAENLCVPYGISITAGAALSFIDVWL